MIETLNALLSLIVLVQAGFVIATTATVAVIYSRLKRPLHRHVYFMIGSYLCLTFVIAYNVVLDHVTTTTGVRLD